VLFLNYLLLLLTSTICFLQLLFPSTCLSLPISLCYCYLHITSSLFVLIELSFSGCCFSLPAVATPLLHSATDICFSQLLFPSSPLSLLVSALSLLSSRHYFFSPLSCLICLLHLHYLLLLSSKLHSATDMYFSQLLLPTLPLISASHSCSFPLLPSPYSLILLSAHHCYS
jgi:hypothetical protein